MDKRGPPTKKTMSRPLKIKAQKTGVRDILDKWCCSYKWLVISLIIVFSVAFRIIYFVQLGRTQLVYQHKWDESDMFVFDQWADSIAGGDVFSERYVQPEHTWMKQTANIFFRDHPDHLEY